MRTRKPAEELEPVFVICLRRASLVVLADDMTGTCAACGHEIRFRPDSLNTGIPICVECTFERFQLRVDGLVLMQRETLQ